MNDQIHETMNEAVTQQNLVIIEAQKQIAQATRVLLYIKDHYPAVFNEALEANKNEP